MYILPPSNEDDLSGENSANVDDKLTLDNIFKSQLASLGEAILDDCARIVGECDNVEIGTPSYNF